MKKNYKRDLQLKILDMVKEIDAICKKHKINYYLAYGSVLGAIRHKGFIPWDDDFDIMLKYDDYNKFIEVCKKELDSNKYFVQTLDTDPNYYLSFGKIRNIQTTLIEETNKNERMINGVYIDVFPLVGYPKSKVKQIILKINRAFVLSANRNIINNKFLSFVFKIILKLIGKNRIIKYCTKECVKYSCDDCNEIISVFDGDGVKIGLTSNKILGKPKRVDFESLKLPIPSDYDAYLKNLYDDYMKLPSKEHINFKTHTPYFLDLNKHYTIDEVNRIYEKKKK